MFRLKTNRNWNFLRKIWNLHIKISIENLLFTHFLSILPGPRLFYTALENNTIYLQQLFRFRGRGKLSPPPPCGRPWFFEYFSINLTNHELIFCEFGRKMQIVENWDNFEKPSENCEKCIILAFFKRILTNTALIISRLDEKHKVLGNLEKIFLKFSTKNWQKMNYFSIFFNRI